MSSLGADVVHGSTLLRYEGGNGSTGTQDRQQTLSNGSSLCGMTLNQHMILSLFMILRQGLAISGWIQ